LNNREQAGQEKSWLNKLLAGSHRKAKQHRKPFSRHKSNPLIEPGPEKNSNQKAYERLKTKRTAHGAPQYRAEKSHIEKVYLMTGRKATNQQYSR